MLFLTESVGAEQRIDNLDDAQYTSDPAQYCNLDYLVNEMGMIVDLLQAEMERADVLTESGMDYIHSDMFEKSLVVRQINTLSDKIAELKASRSEHDRLSLLRGMTGIVVFLLSGAFYLIASNSTGIAVGIIGLVSAFVLAVIAAHHNSQSTGARRELINIGRKMFPLSLRLVSKAPANLKSKAVHLHDTLSELVDDGVRFDLEAQEAERKQRDAQHAQLMNSIMYGSPRRAF